MEFEGTVYRIMPPVKGQGSRGEWTKQEVVFEIPGEYSRKVCVSFWGDRAQDAASLREGDFLTVSFNLESREHNGRWFTEVRAWRIARKSESAAGSTQPAAAYGQPSDGGWPTAQAAPQAELPPMPGKEEVDDLPF